MSDVPSIIIVDDDPDIRETVHTYFESNGFSVSEASNGAELRDLVAGGRFDVTPPIVPL